jgi:hypothetical protein
MHRFLAALVISTSFVSFQCMGFSLNRVTVSTPFRSWNRLANSNPVSQLLFTRLYGTNKRKQGTRSSSGGGFKAQPKPVSTAAVIAAAPRIRALQKVSSEPLIFTIDDFVSAEACAALQNKEQSEEARLKFATLVAGELFAGQWGKNDGLRFNEASSSDANNDELSECSNSPEGLHVDTNNESTFRSVTAILYLNDVKSECGGATVFPLANAKDDDPALVAAKRLLEDRIAHTRGAAGSTGFVMPSQEADALLLEQTVGASPSRSGLSIQPQAGRLCVFFSRTADGEVDPRSWHGGERLKRDFECGDKTTEKRILTLFKEVYYGKLHPETYDTSFEAYLAPQIAEQRQALQVLAQSHASFFVPT